MVKGSCIWGKSDNFWLRPVLWISENGMRASPIKKSLPGRIPRSLIVNRMKASWNRFDWFGPKTLKKREQYNKCWASTFNYLSWWDTHKSKVSSNKGKSVLRCTLVLNLGVNENFPSGTIFTLTYGSHWPACVWAWNCMLASCRLARMDLNLDLTHSKFIEDRYKFEFWDRLRIGGKCLDWIRTIREKKFQIKKNGGIMIYFCWT